MTISLHGKRFTKERIELLEEIFDVIEHLHKEVENDGYFIAADYGLIPDAANDILDLVDKLYVNFAFAKKTLKNIEEEENE